MKRRGASRKPAKVRDLAPAARRTRAVKGGAICKTQSPSGPIPIPYPS